MNFMSTDTTNDVTEVIARPVMRAEALALAHEGFAVLPLYELGPDGCCTCGRSGCSSPGKHPRLKNGVKEATKDVEIIRQWWVQWPDANIGIATGVASEVFVLDVDIKHGGQDELVRLIAERGPIPDTRICQSGGGGFHAYFRKPADQRVSNSASKIAQGIDVRGDGGYVVAPPSNHASGRSYEWNNPDCLIENAPAWVLELCNAPASKSVSAAPTSAAAAPAFLGAGRRNTDFTSLAGSLRAKGWDAPRIEVALCAINQNIADPLPLGELSQLAQGMDRYTPHPKLDELFIADLIVNAFGGLVRHSTALGWMFYDGRVWRPDDGEKFVTQLAKRTVEQFADYAESLEIDGLKVFSAKEIRQIKRRAVLSNTLKIAGSDVRVTASHLDFDAAANLLCLENGTLDLQTQSLREHRHVRRQSH